MKLQNRSQIEALAKFKSQGDLVTSFYMDTGKSRASRKELQLALKNLLSEAKTRACALNAAKDKIESLLGDLDLIADHGGQALASANAAGLAFFSHSQKSFWHALELPHGPRNRVIFDTNFYIRPLAAILDKYSPICALLISRRGAHHRGAECSRALAGPQALRGGGPSAAAGAGVDPVGMATRQECGPGWSGPARAGYEVQKVAGWSETVKALWDEDRRLRVRVRVLLLGSSALLLGKETTESLAGRFFLHRCLHWSFAECRAAFGGDVDRWLFFGGYPGAAPLADDEANWRSYVLDSLIETVLARDVLSMERITKPALLRHLFALAATFPQGRARGRRAVAPSSARGPWHARSARLLNAG